MGRADIQLGRLCYSSYPFHGVRANWATETLQGDFAQLFESESLANAEFGNRIGHHDLFRCGMRAQPAGELNCRSKQIVMLLDGFTCRGTDSNLERALGIGSRVLVQLALNFN